MFPKEHKNSPKYYPGLVFLVIILESWMRIRGWAMFKVFLCRHKFCRVCESAHNIALLLTTSSLLSGVLLMSRDCRAKTQCSPRLWFPSRLFFLIFFLRFMFPFPFYFSVITTLSCLFHRRGIHSEPIKQTSDKIENNRRKGDLKLCAWVWISPQTVILCIEQFLRGGGRFWNRPWKKTWKKN